jgi:hypothetical protein
MRSKMFFVTLATRLIANENGIDRYASRVPTPHTTHLGFHDNAQYNHDRD